MNSAVKLYLLLRDVLSVLLYSCGSDIESLSSVFHSSRLKHKSIFLLTICYDDLSLFIHVTVIDATAYQNCCLNLNFLLSYCYSETWNTLQRQMKYSMSEKFPKSVMFGRICGSDGR